MKLKEEKLYYESEVLGYIMALDNIYYSKPFYIRWFFRPWHTALETLAIMLCKNIIDDHVLLDNSIKFADRLFNDQQRER